jgi:hypothetical protein
MSTTPEDNPSSDRKRPRSPGYPALDLKAALDRARLLYKAEGRNRAPVNTILDHWGYKAGSGAGMVAIAALKKFGLVTDDGSGASRKAKLSEEALRILLDERDLSPEREALIRKAALKPGIYATLWSKYGGELPSDATLRHELIFDYNFTELGASEFIGPFRTTIAFARLGEGDRSQPTDVRNGDEETETHDEGGVASLGANTPGIVRSSPKGGQDISIPVAPGEYVIIRANFPLADGKWQMMLSVLQAMKPALVAPEQTNP